MTSAQRPALSGLLALLLALSALPFLGCEDKEQPKPAAASGESPTALTATSAQAPTPAASTQTPTAEATPPAQAKPMTPNAEEGIALTKPSNGAPLEAPKNPGVTSESCKTVCARMATLAFAAMPKDADPALTALMREAFGVPCFQGCLEEATKESNECIMAAKDLQSLEACAP